MSRATLDQLEAIDGVGHVVAESILAYFSDDDNEIMLDKMARLGVRPKTFEAIRGPLAGIKFVITGTLEMGTRDEVAAKLEALGAKETNTVSKDTTWLIVGDAPEASKLTKAQKLGTKLVDEGELGSILSR